MCVSFSEMKQVLSPRMYSINVATSESIKTWQINQLLI